MADLPRGTVTFLLTDIEGSTALWERDRTAMRGVVTQHLALLRAIAEQHRGALYKTVGDGTQAAFPTAADALRAALEAQRALLAEPRPDPPGPLRVRMALHSGEPEPGDGDYLAAPLNRLARLLGIAHGGQILLTEAVAQLVQDDLPPGASLRDLGEVRLRDLERVERIFNLTHPDLPGDLPLLPSTDGRLRGFPTTLTPFLGRGALVTAVSDLLRRQDVRLVTLTGPGGTGKARLAMRVAEELADDFADGVVFVDLAPLRDPALVLSAVATALGLREGEGRSLDDVVRGYLRERRTLLLLDNFEHLLAAASVVTGFLAAGPDVKVLVTSREPLHVRGEREYPIPSLALPAAVEMGDLTALEANEAVALFIDRARAVRPDLALSRENAATVAAICASRPPAQVHPWSSFAPCAEDPLGIDDGRVPRAHWRRADINHEPDVPAGRRQRAPRMRFDQSGALCGIARAVAGLVCRGPAGRIDALDHAALRFAGAELLLNLDQALLHSVRPHSVRCSPDL
jgi:class 3 adenylate cyclase